MIQVGVNEGVILSKVEINDKNTLTIGVRQAGSDATAGKKSSILDDLSDGSDNSGASGETTFLMFPPNITEYDDATKVLPGEKILEQFRDLKNQLAHFLKRYLTDKEIKFSPFAGLMINMADEADILSKIQLQANVDKVYANYATQFLSQAKPFLNREDKPSRLFLHRRSEAVHFGTLRKKFLADQPFFEDVIIPVNQSKMYTKQTGVTTKHHEPIEIEGVKYVPNFSSYELKKKLDSTERVEQSSDPSQTGEDEIANASNLFTAAAGGDAGVNAAPGIFSVEE